MMSAHIEKAMGLAVDYARWVAEYCADPSDARELQWMHGKGKLFAHLEAREAMTKQLAEALRYVIEHNRAPDGYRRAIDALQAYEEASK